MSLVLRSKQKAQSEQGGRGLKWNTDNGVCPRKSGFVGGALRGNNPGGRLSSLQEKRDPTTYQPTLDENYLPPVPSREVKVSLIPIQYSEFHLGETGRQKMGGWE